MINKYYSIKNDQGVNRKVLDFWKISAEPFNINIIMSGKGKQGKTMSSLQYIRERYLRDGSIGAYVFNTSKMFDNPKWKEPRNMTTYPDDWADVVIKKSGMWDIATKTCFLEFYNLQSSGYAKAGTRRANMRTIIYDEIDENLLKDKANQGFNFQKIMHALFSVSDLPKCKVFLFCNTRTINIPILTYWGIKKLPDGEQEIYKHKNLTINFYVPKTPKEQRQQIAKEKNWLYDLADMTSTFEMDVIGEQAFFDNNVGVVPRHLHFIYKKRTINHYIKVANDKWCKIWADNNQNSFLELKTGELPVDAKFIVSHSRKYIEANVLFDPHSQNKFELLMAEGRLFFDDYITKALFLESIF